MDFKSAVFFPTTFFNRRDSPEAAHSPGNDHTFVANSIFTFTVVCAAHVGWSAAHDSVEHKKWVSYLASNLRAKGIDVIFDDWGLSPGDDVPKFMEPSLIEADRVLMICTSPYVHRANDGKGGVGYEAMIVTAELVKDLGISKFIPILRQAEGQKVLAEVRDTNQE